MVRVSRQTKNWIYRILTIILTMALAAGAIFGIYKIVEKSKEKTKTIHPSFAVGALNGDGEYIKSENSLYTKDAFECQGLNIELDFDNNISYEVFFYDTAGKFLYSSGKQVKNYTFTPSESDMRSLIVSHARIVITPNETEDGAVEVTWFNKSKYSKQLEITVNKSQKDNQNVARVDLDAAHVAEKDDIYIDCDAGYEEKTLESLNVKFHLYTYRINVENKSKLIFTCNVDNQVTVYFLSSPTKIVSHDKIGTSGELNKSYEVGKDISYIYISCTPETAASLCVFLLA